MHTRAAEAHSDVVEVLSEFVRAGDAGVLEDPLVEVLVVAVQPEEVEHQPQPLVLAGTHVAQCPEHAVHACLLRHHRRPATENEKPCTLRSEASNDNDQSTFGYEL